MWCSGCVVCGGWVGSGKMAGFDSATGGFGNFWGRRGALVSSLVGWKVLGGELSLSCKEHVQEIEVLSRT